MFILPRLTLLLLTRTHCVVCVCVCAFFSQFYLAAAPPPWLITSWPCPTHHFVPALRDSTDPQVKHASTHSTRLPNLLSISSSLPSITVKLVRSDKFFTNSKIIRNWACSWKLIMKGSRSWRKLKWIYSPWDNVRSQKTFTAPTLQTPATVFSVQAAVSSYRCLPLLPTYLLI